MDRGSAKQGGELGWFSRDRMVPAFAEAAFAAKVGEVTGPVESRFGYHLIEVEGRRDAVPLEEVRDELAEAIGSHAVNAYLEGLRSGLEITRP